MVTCAFDWVGRGIRSPAFVEKTIIGLKMQGQTLKPAAGLLPGINDLARKQLKWYIHSIFNLKF